MRCTAEHVAGLVKWAEAVVGEDSELSTWCGLTYPELLALRCDLNALMTTAIEKRNVGGVHPRPIGTARFMMNPKELLHECEKTLQTLTFN